MNGRIVVALGLVAAATLGTGCDDARNGAVRLTIGYAGFVPGCVRVRAEDAAAPSKAEERTLTPAEATFDGELVVAVYRDRSWSHDLKLVVTAHEQACTGAAVATQTLTAKVVPGEIAEKSAQLSATDADQDGWVSPANGGTDCAEDRAATNPGATEVCNTLDDDCDGTPDDGAPPAATWADGDGDGYGAGASITECTPGPGRAAVDGDCNDADALIHPDAGERCNALDDDCDGQANDGLEFFPTYPDVDGDGYGAGATIQECAASAGRTPDAGDCNDGNAAVFPGAPERCDGFDNDCDAENNEGFGVGGACATGKTCSGQVACANDGGTGCQEIPLTWFVDFDRDTQGTDAGTALACDAPAGFVATPTDCDDGDPFTFASAAELCDRRDNDCDGTVDEDGACGSGDGGWYAGLVGDANDQWETVATVDRGWHWIAGSDWSGSVDNGNILMVVDGGVTNRDAACSPSKRWTGSWAERRGDAGILLVGGCAVGNGTVCATGLLGKVDSTTTTCSPLASSTDPDRVKGVLGLYTDTGFRVFAVGSGGVAFEANATTLQAGAKQTLTGMVLNDLHGVDMSSVYAVGGETATSNPKVWRLVETGVSQSWISELAIDNLASSLSGEFFGAWVVRPELLYVVGSNGVVMKKQQGTWSQLPQVAGGATVRSVRAFGTSSVYVTAGDDVYRYNGTSWQRVFIGDGSGVLTDIAGTRPDDLIVVGEDLQVGYSRQ